MKLIDVLEGDILPFKRKEEPQQGKSCELGFKAGEDAYYKHFLPLVRDIEQHMRKESWGFRSEQSLAKFINNEVVQHAGYRPTSLDGISAQTRKRLELLANDGALLEKLRAMRTTYKRLYDEFGDCLELGSLSGDSSVSYFSLLTALELLK